MTDHNPAADEVRGQYVDEDLDVLGALPSVHQAVAACIADVKAVGKDSEVTSGPARFHFRGVDAVVNAAHIVLAKHQVIVAPVSSKPTYGTVQFSGGKSGRLVDLEVTFRWFGPRGDHFDTQVYGEAMDSGDKATSKAASVAYRTALLQTLSLPTGDPDPDEGQYEPISQGAAAHAATPLLPQDVVDAREAVRGAWTFHYGKFVPDEVATSFAQWSGGEVLTEVAAPRLRQFAGFLAALPTKDAGGDPNEATLLPPASEQPTQPAEPRPMTKLQQGKIFASMADLGLTERQQQLEFLMKAVGRTLKSRSELTREDAKVVIDILEEATQNVSGPAPSAQSAAGESRLPAGPETHANGGV